MEKSLYEALIKEKSIGKDFKNLGKARRDLMIKELIRAEKEFNASKIHSLQDVFKIESSKRFKYNLELVHKFETFLKYISDLRPEQETVLPNNFKSILSSNLENLKKNLVKKHNDYELYSDVFRNGNIDLRRLNARPRLENRSLLIENIFKIFWKHLGSNFKSFKGRDLLKERRIMALKMSKFTSIVTNTLNVTTESYRASSDNIEIESAQWSRLSKRALKFIHNINS